jgi:putative transposase
MLRQARSVFANIPHHITQRGNRKNDVFFCDADKDYYLALLQEYTSKHKVEVLAYCLMSNHVHLILVPSTEDGLQKALKPLHMRYSQYINRQQNISGILWQGRFFSSPLDEQYTYYAFAYVENNPVEANMVENATDYKYSSARHHVGIAQDNLIADYDIGIKQNAYLQYLQTMLRQKYSKVLKENTHKGLPCGSDEFITGLSDKIGRDLSFRGVGRPEKRVASPFRLNIADINKLK